MTADDTPPRRTRRPDASDTDAATQSADPATPTTPTPRAPWWIRRRLYRRWLLYRVDRLTGALMLEGRFWTKDGAEWRKGVLMVDQVREPTYPPTRYEWMVAHR